MRMVDGETTPRPGGSDEYHVKNREPSIMAHIRAAKIMPKGRSVPWPESWWASRRAGNLKNIQRYIDPSKKQDVIARAQIRLSG